MKLLAPHQQRLLVWLIYIISALGLPQSLPEKSASGSTGYQPVPSGDSPDGRGRTLPTHRSAGFDFGAHLVSVGGSPTEAGESPALPLFQTSAQVFAQEIKPQTGSETEKRFPPLKVPTGFKATLFACDPFIEYPSAIALGPKTGHPLGRSVSSRNLLFPLAQTIG